MTALPPGTILQLMYIKERLQSIKPTPGYFIEVGPGSGEITHLLLDLGWHGKSYDLDYLTIQRLQNRFSQEIAQGRYLAANSNYLDCSSEKHYEADLVISCMVIEHLDENSECTFMQKSSEMLNQDGFMICLVPASPRHWGIEDEIAGHYRRYSESSVKKLLLKSEYSLQHIAGLTFPLSNFLLPISNFLVRRSESKKLNFALNERTKASGRRKVKFKTYFPRIFNIILNEKTLYPFHLLQKIFKGSRNSLVIYFECQPATKERNHGLSCE